MNNTICENFQNVATGATAAFIVAFPFMIQDQDSVLINTGSQTAAENIPEYCVNDVVPPSPMGQELNDVLFSDPEFEQYYNEFSQELDSDLDRQYKEGSISPMKYYRMKLGMTQSELATKIGDTQSHISRWEAENPIKVSMKNAIPIARALNITIEELTNGNHG